MTIDDVMPKICEAAAAAVEGYAKVTGEDAGEDVPESFIQSFVFDQLGKTGVTMTLESNCRKLSDWNNEGRMRRQMPPTDENALAAALRELNRNSRVDLVLFDGATPAFGTTRSRREGGYPQDIGRPSPVCRAPGTAAKP